jgi:hypothetical protein
MCAIRGNPSRLGEWDIYNSSTIYQKYYYSSLEEELQFIIELEKIMPKNNIFIPLNYNIQKPRDLFGDLIRDFFTAIDKSRNYEMLYRYCAFGGQKKLTLEEIGILYSVTRERVRQVTDTSRNHFKELLLTGNFDNRFKIISLFPDLADLFELYDKKLMNKGIFSDKELIELTQQHFGLLEINVHILAFILEIYNFRPVDTGSTDTIAWVSTSAQPDRIQEVLRTVFRYLRDECIDKSLEEIVLGVNRNRPKDQRLTTAEIIQALTLHDDIEIKENDRYQVKINMLSGYDDKIFRIVYQNNKRMHVRDITRLLNKFIGQDGRSGATQQHIGGRMSADPRFQNIGKSGEWFLTDFSTNEISTKHIVPLMEDALHATGDILTEEKIYEYVSSRRPVEKSSISIYLSSHRSFVKVKGGYALAAWKPEPIERQKRIVQPVDVGKLSEIIELVFKDREVSEIPLAELTREISPLYKGVGEQKLLYWLMASPAIRVLERAENGKRMRRIASFNPNYKAHLKDETLSVLLSIQQTAREILAKQPEKRMLMSSLRDQITKKLHSPKASVYAALSRMVDLEKTGERTKKYCALRSSEQAYTEYVNQIVDPQLKSLVKRAISMLNEDSVDLALFDLGRLFENTLKDLLLAMETKSLLTSNPKAAVKDMRLNDLVGLAEREKITIVAAPLHYQRIHRNDRTHGVPSLEERRALLITCPTEVPYYLVYLILLEQRLNSLPV